MGATKAWYWRPTCRRFMLAFAAILVIAWVLSGFWYFSANSGNWGVWIGQGYVQAWHPAPLPPGWEVNQFYEPDWGYWFPRISLTSLILPLWIPIAFLAYPTIAMLLQSATMRYWVMRFGRSQISTEPPMSRRLPRPIAALVAMLVAPYGADCVARLAFGAIGSFLVDEEADWKRAFLYWLYKKGYHPGNTAFELWMTVLSGFQEGLRPVSALVCAYVTYRLMRRIHWRARHCLDDGTCHQCGYDLTGNISGICPECGADTVRDRVPEAGAEKR